MLPKRVLEAVQNSCCPVECWTLYKTHAPKRVMVAVLYNTYAAQESAGSGTKLMLPITVLEAVQNSCCSAECRKLYKTHPAQQSAGSCTKPMLLSSVPEAVQNLMLPSRVLEAVQNSCCPVQCWKLYKTHAAQ